MPSIGGQDLSEVTLLVKNPDPNNRQSHIAGGLQIVRGQNSEATRVNRECLRHAKLHAEVGNPSQVRIGESLFEPPGIVQILLPLFQFPLQTGDQFGITSGIIQSRLRNLTQNQMGIVRDGECLGIKAFPESVARVTPVPADIQCKVAQAFQ